MLAAAQATSLTGSREVIIAIVGGTMLTLALTRPRLRWVERLTDEGSKSRLNAERALTCLSLVMLGYALITVDAALHKQLDSGTNGLLRGAVVFLVIYGWLVHFEPFVREWRLNGNLAACLLYSFVFSAMGVLGLLLAEAAETSSLPANTAKLSFYILTMLVCGWLSYRVIPAIDRGADRATDWLTERLKGEIPSERADEPDGG
jgi:hypothetical protein